jgi:hypothetical protein
MHRRIALCGLASMLVTVLVFLVVRPSLAQAPTRTRTSEGLIVEEVQVGKSCVIVISRADSGAGDHVAAVPCR